MTRAVFLSAGGDPFIGLFTHYLFKKYWYEEADKFYVCLNNHSGVPKEVIKEYITNLVDDPKVELIYHPRGIGNGMPITEMTKIATEDLVMLLEDDGFIFTPSKVNEYFSMIEKDLTDAVGSPRFSCAEEIAQVSAKKYGLNYEGLGDKGPNFWPNFFFMKRNDLLKTDLNFGSIQFKEGDYCKELDHTFAGVAHGDTFVWACIQLRALGLRFSECPQFHADPDEIRNKEHGEINWAGGKPFWLHGGSLSASWGGYLSGQAPVFPDETAKKEMESRVAFWKIASDVVDGFVDFKREYQQGIEALIDKAKLDRKRIGQKISIYRSVMNV